jgi:predicted small metal-binding protein
MRQFVCGEIVPGCETRIEGESDDEVLAKVAVHAREAHGMDEVPQEVADDVRSKIRDAGQS